MDSINPNAPGASVSENSSISESKQTITTAPHRPPQGEKFDAVIKRGVAQITDLATKPGGSKPTRDINMTGISEGKNGALEIKLASGGGFAQVSLTKDGAKFTMNTPAYLKDAPGITTQNALEFNVKFSDLSPKQHAQLVNELKSALQDASEGGAKKSEAPLIENALEILDTPAVNQELTLQSALASLKELLTDAFEGIKSDEWQDCKHGFDKLNPRTVFGQLPISLKPKPTFDAFLALSGKESSSQTDAEIMEGSIGADWKSASPGKSNTSTAEAFGESNADNARSPVQDNFRSGIADKFNG